MKKIAKLVKGKKIKTCFIYSNLVGVGAIYYKIFY